MRFEPLTSKLVAIVEPWFDDPETIRYLGRRDWVQRALLLVRQAPGAEFKGNIVLSRHAWVVFDQTNQPVGLIDIEPYNNGTAGMAFVVAPQVRGHGIGRRMLLDLGGQPELKAVHTIIGGVEPENISCRICLTKAGYMVAAEADEEGMLRVEKKLR